VYDIKEVQKCSQYPTYDMEITGFQDQFLATADIKWREASRIEPLSPFGQWLYAGLALFSDISNRLRVD